MRSALAFEARRVVMGIFMLVLMRDRSPSSDGCTASDGCSASDRCSASDGCTAAPSAALHAVGCPVRRGLERREERGVERREEAASVAPATARAS